MEISVSDRLNQLPEENWNLAFIFTYDADLERFQQFQNTYPSCDIILWAEDAKWARVGIRLHTKGFLTVPVSEAQFAQAMKSCRGSWLDGMKTLKGTADGDPVMIHCAEIQYAKADGHRSAVYTQTHRILVNMSISAMAALLGESFIHCHRSYLVNLCRIHSLNPDSVLLCSGALVPLGAGKTAEAAEERLRAFRSKMGEFAQGGLVG